MKQRHWGFPLFFFLVFAANVLVNIYTGHIDIVTVAFAFMAGMDADELLNYRFKRPVKPMIACDISQTRKGVTTCSANICCQHEE